MLSLSRCFRILLLIGFISLFSLCPDGPNTASAMYKYERNNTNLYHLQYHRKPATPKYNEITKAEFIAEITEFFGWPHPNDYNDIWKTPPKKFTDVETTDTYGKLIEAAYEEGIIEGDGGYFYPDSGITREEAAIILAEAFKLPASATATNFTDSDSISGDALSAVNALVELGCMPGRTATKFAPQALLKREEFLRIFRSLSATVVAPTYALPRQNYEAPRRYVKLYTATPGATIYYTSDGTDPVVGESEIYTVYDKGHINEMLSNDQLPTRDVVYKAITVKDGMVPSEVQTFTWHLYRPIADNYQSKLILQGDGTSPTVYQIFNDAESVRAMAWYIEGQDKAMLFDALQTSADSEYNLVDYIQGNLNLGGKELFLVVGHEHGDHDAQAPNFLRAGLEVYLNDRGWSGVIGGFFGALFSGPGEQALVKDVDEGDSFDLGGCVFDVYAMPGHANGNIVIQDKEHGLIFSSDIYGCTRAGSADNVGVSGLKVDRLLSFTQQTYSNYKKNGGLTTMLFTGHDESPLNDNNLKLFEAALQQVIDKGEEGCSPTLRGKNNAPYSRTTLIGDMWKDGTNWISLMIGGIMGDNYEYLTNTPVNADGETTAINYNTDLSDPDAEKGFMKYSVLSNIEIEGGELEGVEVTWADPREFEWAGETITTYNSLPNKFDPWTYDYVINVPAEADTITIIPTTMSTQVKSIRINGKKVEYRSRNTLAVEDSSVITIDIVAPDKVTTSSYTFTVEKY